MVVQTCCQFHLSVGLLVDGRSVRRRHPCKNTRLRPATPDLPTATFPAIGHHCRLNFKSQVQRPNHCTTAGHRTWDCRYAGKFRLSYWPSGAVLGKNIGGTGGWPLIIWEATTAKRNYYRTNYIKHMEKLGLNYPEKIWGLGKIWGACAPWPQHRTATAGHWFLTLL